MLGHLCLPKDTKIYTYKDPLTVTEGMNTYLYNSFKGGAGKMYFHFALCIDEEKQLTCETVSEQGVYQAHTAVCV